MMRATRLRGKSRDGLIRNLRRNVNRAYDRVGRDALEEANSTAKFWVDRPEFEAKVKASGDHESLEVVLVKDIGVVDSYRVRPPAWLKWLWADKGTRGHRIQANRAPQLVYRQNNHPDTPRYARPARSQGTPLANGRKSGAVIRTDAVDHPGTTPRNFSDQIRKDIEPIFVDAMIRAMLRALSA